MWSVSVSIVASSDGLSLFAYFQIIQYGALSCTTGESGGKGSEGGKEMQRNAVSLELR